MRPESRASKATVTSTVPHARGRVINTPRSLHSLTPSELHCFTTPTLVGGAPSTLKVFGSASYRRTGTRVPVSVPVSSPSRNTSLVSRSRSSSRSPPVPYRCRYVWPAPLPSRCALLHSSRDVIAVLTWVSVGDLYRAVCVQVSSEQRCSHLHQLTT